MKYIVELNPAMHIEHVEIEAESEAEAVAFAKTVASTLLR